MITIKASTGVKIIFTFFIIAWPAAVFTACDRLESDVTKPTVVVTDNEVYTLTDRASIIDLSSKIQTSQPVKLSITRTTRHGTLTALDKGLLQYVPNAGTSRDSFTFTVYDAGNNAIKEDSVIIFLKSDVAQLPCVVYPVQDSVLLYPQTKPGTSIEVFIPVLANDIICEHDISDVQLSVYRYPNDPYLRSGQAVVVGNEIKYTSNGDVTADAFLYALQFKSNPSQIFYGCVYIRITELDSLGCRFAVHDYRTTVVNDTTTSSNQFRIAVLAVDTLCYDPRSYQYHILQSFRGTSTINYDGLLYAPNAFTELQRTDTVRYEICRDSICKSANVLITLKQ